MNVPFRRRGRDAVAGGTLLAALRVAGRLTEEIAAFVTAGSAKCQKAEQKPDGDPLAHAFPVPVACALIIMCLARPAAARSHSWRWRKVTARREAGPIPANPRRSPSSARIAGRRAN